MHHHLGAKSVNPRVNSVNNLPKIDAAEPPSLALSLDQLGLSPEQIAEAERLLEHAHEQQLIASTYPGRYRRSGPRPEAEIIAMKDRRP
jgi:hypothetical protein